MNAEPSSTDLDSLVSAAPPEKGSGCAGCLLSVAWLFVTPALLGLLPINARKTPELFVITILGLLVGAGYMFFLPTATRRGWVRRRRLRRIIKRRPLPGGSVDKGTLRLPLAVFGGGPDRSTDDAGFDRPLRLALVDARQRYGLRLEPDGRHIALHTTALAARSRALTKLIDTLAEPIGWLAAADDPQVAWWVALVLSEDRDPEILGEALRRLLDHAPESPQTARVMAHALARQQPAFRLAAAVAARHRPTLEALSAPKVIDQLDGQLVLDVLDGRSTVDDDGGDSLRHHPHPAMRLAWVSRRRAAPTEALVELAGDGWGMTRAVAWNRLVRSNPAEPGALTAAARRVTDADNDPTRHPITPLLAQHVPDTRGDPLPAALAHLGQHGVPEDVRRVARWMNHPEHGRSARRARAEMHVRLGDRLASGHLSLPTQTAGGELSPVGGGELSAAAPDVADGERDPD